MSRSRLALAAILLVAAVFAALLASDLRSWRDGVQNGDALFNQRPASAFWDTPTILPLDPARKILGVSDQIAFRRAAQDFERVHKLGRGFDNGFAASRARADLEVTLEAIGRGPSRERNSAANNLHGILAYSDSQTTGTTKPARVERAVVAFQSAVQLDPGNTDAKFNLEWLHRSLRAKYAREQARDSGGGTTNKGKQGGGNGTPNKGF